MQQKSCSYWVDCCCVQATLTLSPLFVNKLNKLGSDLNGANGRQNVPTSTYEFLQRLKDVLSSMAPVSRA